MFGYTMRSRLAGLASKPILRSRVFSAAPSLREGINVRTFFGSRNTGKTPKFVTAEGLRNVTKFSQAHAVARAEASLKARDAHNCYLSFTSEVLAHQPVPQDDTWKAQMGAAIKIVEHEQRLAVLRAGISAPWLTVMHADPEIPLQCGVAFRLPKMEDPDLFQERLRTAGLIGGDLLVWPRAMDKWWESFAKGRGERLTKFG